VLWEALKLSPDERARIAAELLATLEPDLPSEGRSEAEGFGGSSGGPGLPWPAVQACRGLRRVTRFGAGSRVGEGRPPLLRGDR